MLDRCVTHWNSDPVTLADLFKQFLASLPDPVMTGHLFKLFIACSREFSLCFVAGYCSAVGSRVGFWRRSSSEI